MSVLDPNPLCAGGGADGGWPNTEYDAGRRLGWEFSRRLRWCQEKNSWMIYKNGRWAPEDMEQSRVAATAICTAQIQAHNGEGHRHAQFIKNVLLQARGWLAIRSSDFDNDPWLMCCADGVLSLRSEDCGTLLAHSADFLMTLSTEVRLRHYADEKGVVRLPEDWGWSVSEWEKHLRYMTQNMEEEKAVEFRDFFCRWSGVALVGSQNLKPHHFLNLTGSGRNGKSVAVEARVNALGDYGMVGPIRLVTRKQSDHSTELASCEGKRFLAVEEVSFAQAAVVKDLTGGGTMTARRMRMDDVTFQKSWTLEMLSNQPLNLQGENSKAIKRRKIVAHLGDEIAPKHHRDGIIDELRAENDLILCWMVDGLRRWHDDGGRSAGLRIPEWMAAAGEEQADDDDVIGGVLAERFERCVEDECRVLASDFVRLVNERRKDSSFLAMTPAAIYAYLRDRGFAVKPGSRNRMFVYGIRGVQLSLGEMAEMADTGGRWN